MKLNKLFLLGAAVVLAFAGACSDDDDAIKTALGQPDPTSTATSVNSLTFNWNKVSDAVQYGCELTDPNGEAVATEVTKKTEITFTGLKPATTYTLTVWAYAALNSDKATSKVATLTATTAATVALATPDNLVADTNGETVTVSWDAVDNAESYSYEYYLPNSTDTIKGDVTDTYVDLTGLKQLDYTFTVVAKSNDIVYTVSDKADFSFKPSPTELWTVTGNFNSSTLGTTYTCDLTSFDDGSYCLKNWFGVDGFDFYFKTEDGEVIPWGDYAENGNSYVIPTGLTDKPIMELSTESGKASEFEGTFENGGKVTIKTFGTTDYFVWNAQVKELWRVDGQYYCHETDATYDGTLIAYDNGTYMLKPWTGVDGYNLEFKVDANGDVTEVLDYYGYYDGYGYWVNTGLDDIYGLYVYTDEGYSYMTGDRKAGAIYFETMYNTWGYDTFTWNTEGKQLTADDLVGTYTYVTSGQECVEDGNWNKFSYDGTFELKKNAAGKLVFDNFYWEDEPVEGVFDPTTMTITIQPTTDDWDYTFAGDDDDATPVVGIVSDDLSTITFTKWNFYYDGYQYFYNTKTVFTRQ